MGEREEPNGDVGPATGERVAADRPFDGSTDVFADERMDPAVVEASVDALFERFEEDTPEEVMLADPEAASAFAGDEPSGSDGVLSRLRSSFPF